MVKVIIIIDCNGAIGYRGGLLCHLPADLKRFKNITMGHPLLMGRKTFESLPQILPGRHHYVATRNLDFHVQDEHVTVLRDAQVFLAEAGAKDYFVIGGGELYRLALPYADKLYVTMLDGIFEADTYCPEILAHNLLDEWEVDEEIDGVTDHENIYPHRFVTYVRRTERHIKSKG